MNEPSNDTEGREARHKGPQCMTPLTGNVQNRHIQRQKGHWWMPRAGKAWGQLMSMELLLEG